MSALLHVTHNRDLLIEQHRSYVRALAIDIAKTLPRHIDLEELVAYGNLGLIEAAERYDPRYRASFKTFAWYRIRGAIFDAVRQMGPFSRASHSNLRRAAYANDILQTMAEGELSPDAVSAQSVPDKAKQTQAAIDSLIPVYLLSLDSGEVPDLEDHKTSALEELEQRELLDVVRVLVAELPEDDRRLIEAVYFKQCSLVEYAASIGVTKSWTSRLHARAIKRLRELMVKRGLLKA